MKKYIVIALCVLLLMVASMPVLAAEETKITVTPSATVVQRGETVNFTVSVSGDVSFTSIAVKLKFDENVFEYVSAQDKTNGTGMLIPYDGIGTIGMMLTGGGTYNGELQVLTFKVKDTAPIATSAVTGVSPAGTAPNGSSITVHFAGTTISINCEHSYGDWVVDGDKHKKVCSKCLTPVTEGHEWNEGLVTTAPTCTTAGEETYTCLYCSATKKETITALGHSWDNACDTTCNRGCGQTRTTTHIYATTWSSNATNHWHACSSCGDKKDITAHTPGPAATEKAAQTCTICNYEIASALAHVHDMSTEWITDSTYHWHRCTKSGCYDTEDKAKHDYDDACDTSCNTCSYIREAPHNYNPELQANAQGHWNICTLCGVKSDILEHNPGPEATETEPQICEDCNFRIKMPLSHVHEYGDLWYGDDTNHWQSCIDCVEVTMLEPHTWDEGVTQKDGSILYICTVCSYQLVTTEPIGTEPSTEPSTQTAPTETQNPTQTEGESRFPWEWAGVAAIVLLIIGIVLLVIEFIRSRKTNVHGKFSK